MTQWHSEKLAPLVCFQALLGCLRLTTAASNPLSKSSLMCIDIFGAVWISLYSNGQFYSSQAKTHIGVLAQSFLVSGRQEVCQSSRWKVCFGPMRRFLSWLHGRHQFPFPWKKVSISYLKVLLAVWFVCLKCSFSSFCREPRVSLPRWKLWYIIFLLIFDLKQLRDRFVCEKWYPWKPFKFSHLFWLTLYWTSAFIVLARKKLLLFLLLLS